MAANRSREQRLELKTRAWRLAVEGRSQYAIAEELGLSQPQVSRYLASARSTAWEQLVEDVKTYAILSLTQTDRVLYEALKAFERSTKPKKSATQKKSNPTTSADGTPKGAASAEGTTTTQLVEREGDAVWLGEVRAAIRLRHELLDRFAPHEDDRKSQVRDVASALLEAEARDAEYHSAEEPKP